VPHVSVRVSRIRAVNPLGGNRLVIGLAHRAPLSAKSNRYGFFVRCGRSAASELKDATPRWR